MSAFDDHWVLAHLHDEVGEGPLWSARENALYWVDLFAPALHRITLGDRKVRSWPMPDLIGWVVERAGESGLLAGMRTGVVGLTLEPIAVTPLVTLDARAGHRLNDAKVDPVGRLWAGTMPMDAATPTGSLFRVGADLAPVAVDDGYFVSNGPTFSGDGRTLYHADSMRGVVFGFDVTDAGTLANRREHIVFPPEWGLPDGMTVDAEDCLWVAHWDGWRVSRFDAAGALIRDWRLPASRITSCAFGGADLDRLFVTSAAQDRRHEPLAGALFEINPGVRGIALMPFAD